MSFEKLALYWLVAGAVNYFVVQKSSAGASPVTTILMGPLGFFSQPTFTPGA
jgi:hypothetical protein